MKKSRAPWKILAAAAVTAAAIITVVPSESLRFTLDLMQASVSGANYGELMVVINDPTNPTRQDFVYKTPISRHDLDRLKSMASEIPRSDYVVAARKQLAEKRGYEASTFGAGNVSLVSGGMRLERVEVKESMSGKIETLYGRTRRGSQGSAFL